MRRRRFIKVAAGLLAGTAAGAAGAQGTGRFAGRFQQILQDAAAQPRPQIVLLGDSITQQLRAAWLRSICGLPVLNAGVSGAGIFDFDDLLPQLLQATRPRLVVLALGVNDAKWRSDYARLLPAFDARYRAVIRQIEDSGARVLLSLPLPVEPGKPNSTYHDGRLLERIREAVLAIAESQKLPLSDARELFSEDGPALTFDGVHLNETGLKRWSERLERDVRALGPGGDCTRPKA